MKNRSQGRRRAAVLGLSALVGVATAAFGVDGATQHDGVAVQRDVALVNAADDAHQALVDSQVTANHAWLTEQQNIQENIYYWGQQNGVNMFPGDSSDPQDSILNGAISRWTEAALVDWVRRQVQWDHFLGVNQTLGTGGYETALGDGLSQDLSGAGIAGNATLTADVAALTDPSVVVSYSAFHDAITTLESDLYQTMASDLFAGFTL